MCELFGMCAEKSFDCQSLLHTFFSHSDQHPNGWGLATFPSGTVLIEKEPIQASKSPYLKKRLEDKLEGKALLAHIRYATIGHIEYENCHPFTKKDNFGQSWTLIHNGTIFDYPPLLPYQLHQLGETDSERILLYLVDKINQLQKKLERKLDPKEQCVLIDTLISQMAPGNKLNLILYDGKRLYAHTNATHSLYFKQENNAVVLATVPLDQESWQPLPFTSLCVFQDGHLIYQGKPHGAEYVTNPLDMQYLFTTYSAL